MSLQALDLVSVSVEFGGTRALLASFPASGLSACSACAGEYEDPDETTWTQVSEQDHGQEQQQQEELSGGRN